MAKLQRGQACFIYFSLPFCKFSNIHKGRIVEENLHMLTHQIRHFVNLISSNPSLFFFQWKLLESKISICFHISPMPWSHSIQVTIIPLMLLNTQPAFAFPWRSLWYLFMVICFEWGSPTGSTGCVQLMEFAHSFRSISEMAQAWTA